MTLPPLPAELGGIVEATALSGGDIGQVWRVRFDNGTQAVVKHAPTAAELEAEGLAALHAAGGAVPQVLAVDGQVLVLEFAHGQGDPAAFGRMLADMHTHGREAFGWHRDNVIGPLPQANPWTDRWPTFFVTQRIVPYLDVVPVAVRHRLQAAIERGRFEDVLDHDVTPSLVHGDLWSGNVLGWRWMIDPAVHYADREVDLAMLDLFGHIPDAMLRAYEAHWPLDPDVSRRRDVLQLAPLLIHVRLFGDSYLGAIVARLDRLGW